MIIVVTMLLIFGLIFFAGGAVGILRFPDFYTRLHPAGKLDTLGSLLMLIGLALFNLHHLSLANLLTSLKIILIVVFILSGQSHSHPWHCGCRGKGRPCTLEKRGEKEVV